LCLKKKKENRNQEKQLPQLRLKKKRQLKRQNAMQKTERNSSKKTMDNTEFEEAITFNLVDEIAFRSNAIVVKNIKVDKACVIQVFAFDFGKVLSQKKSPFTQFIHIIEGKAEVVIN